MTGKSYSGCSVSLTFPVQRLGLPCDLSPPFLKDWIQARREHTGGPFFVLNTRNIVTTVTLRGHAAAIGRFNAF